MKKLLLCLSLFISVLDAASRTQVHMGTLITIEAEDHDLSDQVFALFQELDNRLSTYKSDSEISRLGREGDLIVTPMTAEVLNRSLELSALSNGAFDVTIGTLTHDVYGFGHTEHIPTAQAIKKALPKVNYKRLHLEKNHAYIDANTTIDLGGIAKGYAVDLSFKILEDHNVTHAIVSASGDIGCLGECVVNVQDPFHPKGSIATITSKTKRFAVSTSGNYERYIKNKKYNHLIDPVTGKSAQQYASITLIDTKDNTRIDALATAVSVMEKNTGRRLLDSLGIAYLLIYTDRTIIKSKMPDGVILDISEL